MKTIHVCDSCFRDATTIGIRDLLLSEDATTGSSCAVCGTALRFGTVEIVDGSEFGKRAPRLAVLRAALAGPTISLREELDRFRDISKFFVAPKPRLPHIWVPIGVRPWHTRRPRTCQRRAQVPLPRARIQHWRSLKEKRQAWGLA